MQVLEQTGSKNAEVLASDHMHYNLVPHFLLAKGFLSLN